MTNQKMESDKATILVVEDHSGMRKGIQEILEKAGYQVRTADNGKAGLEALRECQPNLIVSNIMMPVMDGREFLKAVRKHPAGIKIPFIFLTACGRREDISAARLLGADDYLIKPISPEELVIAVKARLQRFEELLGS